METLLNQELRKDVKDCSIKVENLPKQVIFKGLAPRVILTNHLLPKGTKAKVNLEEQGRQKISFSFAQTKKPRQNVFLAPPSPEKSASEHSSALQAGPVPTPDLAGQSDETKNVDTDTPAEVGETQAAPAPVSFPLKSKPVLGKMHFKKQILSVTVVEDNSIVTTTSAEISEPAVPSESDKIRSSAKIETETSLQQPHKNSVIDSSSEKVLKEENPQEKVDSCLKGPVSSHIGKGDKDTSVISEHEENRKSQSRSDTTLPGSESDGDSIRTSSSQKSSDHRNKIKSECPSNEAKRSSNSKTEEAEKSRHDRKEDEKVSSRSKSERDSRHTSSRSSRSDRDRRRTKSRSRSRSRGCRNSSYSRSERSRSERQSRSDRSHYHDSERRFHRSSPHRERRGSRSRTDGRSRDSSDSEDDHRRTRTRGSDSSRSSTYSSSQKDSKSATHSRSHRDSKPTDCSRSSESDKRTQHSKSERSHLKAGDSESNRKSSPEAEAVHRKSSSHSKSEINAKTSNSNPATSCRTSEKKVHKNSSDSDEEHRKRRRSQGSDKSSMSGTSSSKKTDSTDHKTLNNVTGTERQSKDRSSNNTKQSQLSPSPVTPQKECSKIDDNAPLPKSKCISQQMHEATHKVNLFKTNQQTEQQAPNQELSSLGKCTNVPEKESTSTTSRSLEVRSSTDEPVMNNEIPIQSKALAEGTTDSFCEGHTPDQDSEGSLADPLSVKELPPGGCLKFNTKLDGPSHITQSAELCEKDSEQHYVNPEQPSSGILKKDSSAKKSRWDIVGQATSENQSPPKILSPDVKKDISVKRIELNNDTTPEESCTQNQDSEVPVEKQIQDTTSAESHQKLSSRASDLETQHIHGELIKQIFEDPQSTSAPVVSDLLLNCISGSKEKINVDKPKPETQDPDSLNHDGKCHSEDSESEESDSDSDDGRVSLKRLHSVVVVPKNSTIALEINDLTEPSPGSSVFSGQQQTDKHESINREFGYGFNNQSKLEESSAHFKASAQATMLSPDIKCFSYQSQSNMVDSTSHSEATSARVDKNRSAQERLNNIQINQASLQSFEKTCMRPESDHHQYHDRPDSWNGRKGGKQHYENSTDFNSGKGYGLAWDFNQSEQPSSTFQQPDSSHGTEHLPQPGIALFDSGHIPGQLAQPDISKTNRPVNAHVPFQYHDSVKQIHPDSLTNDHDDDRVVGIKQGSILSPDLPGSSPFVQAHEISSNCSFTTESQNTSEAPREDNQKPHRGRGPPKKRRPEFESESDNEAEAGLTSKKECLDESSRVLKDGKVERPLLSLKEFLDPAGWREKAKQKKMPPYFDLIEENLYLTERKKNKSHRDIKRMQCECAILSREERARGMMACGEDCLNRLLMIECSSRCLNGAYCSNRRFQMKQHADFEVILTESKGWGLRAAKDLQPNTFVLEYCGEVLDHREFKARVKEYARNKNIHYYFMALKNNEIIDATLKGNCSRFMNHSCEPNCETQKWTVNGQLRVGFFTTKAVTAGTELTFDYQFQRYGKEAQKCFCGAPSCRGLIGGETRVSVRAAGGKKQRERSRKKDTDSLDEELEALQENGEGLCGEKDVISLCRLMVRVETMEQRLTCLKLIQNTQNPLCLKQFLDHHGLSLLWIFMVELSEAKSNSVNNIKLQLEIMKALAVLPISTKNMLEESRVLQFIQRWAQSRPLSQPTEQDGYSSESTSRAQTPLNTPDGPPAKLASELDGDTPKRAVYRRLKIISENSLDSAMSDASKASDGKEEEDEEEEEMEDETSQLEATIEREVKVENSEAPSEKSAPTESPPASEETTPPETGAAVGTPSQDEEEGVSDVESERSQEPQVQASDISDMAARLLDSWKDLKARLRFVKSRDAPIPFRSSLRSADRKRRRGSTSPLPPSAYERGRRNDDRYEQSSSKKKLHTKESRNKLSTEERRKLFEQEVAQREAQKQQQQQQQQQQQLQTLAFNPLAYTSSPNFLAYPPGYPIQTYVDPTNPNAGKVLLPTPAVEPLCVTPAPGTFEQTPTQPIISDLASPSSTTTQAGTASSLAHIPASLELSSGTQTQQFVQPAVPAQDPNVAILSVPAQTASPQIQGQQGYTTLWDPNTQQAVTVQTQPTQQYSTTAQPQTAIYYQGQPCQTIYSIPAGYPQTNTPVIQTYTEPAASYLHGQQVYTGHQQGVVVQQGGTVTTIVTSQTVQQEMIVPNSIIDLPPPSPPKPKTIILPPSWKVARDPEGRIYYYHIITRQTQWDPPNWDGTTEEASLEHEAEMDLGTPTYDENPSKFSTKTAEADTSSELAKKSKEVFRKEVSFRFSWLTHGVMNKELKSCKNPEDLECNENVKHKTKEYIKKYMQKFGTVYRPKEDTELD
uniref:[histone H3]-lysine(36) N-trimethyltransferase n=1 Tax=Cyprinus carpio TaxID=7962 RepID=A0A8C2HJG7_CYPCA